LKTKQATQGSPSVAINVARRAPMTHMQYTHTQTADSVQLIDETLVLDSSDRTWHDGTVKKYLYDVYVFKKVYLNKHNRVQINLHLLKIRA